ncbi:hypothetical protein JIY74_24975 [Vibrio harveyi]|nr:hypothetical protein [Vibrio harveyi]
MIPNFNPLNKNTIINETAVTTSALIKGTLAIEYHLFLVALFVLLKPIAARVPIITETIVEITATNIEVKIDFKNGESENILEYHLNENPSHPKVVSPPLNESTTIATIGA